MRAWVRACTHRACAWAESERCQRRRIERWQLRRGRHVGVRPRRAVVCGGRLALAAPRVDAGQLVVGQRVRRIQA
eukprot:COSAG01_NODE_2143_length_8317_cov_24.964103_6_plen_75_part_00